jgi:hypothetical protein
MPGNELYFDHQSGLVVDTVGTYCHGIAFFEDKTTSQIKLISLDSKQGALVSVVLSPATDNREREVLWTPDLNNPVLTALNPNRKDEGYKNMFVFSKGLAVQGGVAYFSVSGARRPRDRSLNFSTLLVAYDLSLKRELWIRTIDSSGLINQVVSMEYLNSGCGEDRCFEWPEGEEIKSEEEVVADEGGTLQDESALHENGGLDGFALFEKEFPNLQVAEFDSGEKQCIDEFGKTNRIPFDNKWDHTQNFAHICQIDVSLLQQRLSEIGDVAFQPEGQKTNAQMGYRTYDPGLFKPGNTRILLVFSDKTGKDVYRFPWLKDWLPLLEETVFGPLHIDPNRIVRMQLAKMPRGSKINTHYDKGGWASSTHRFHVPIVTHSDVYFMSKLGGSKHLQIPCIEGAVFEVNNIVTHAVRNYGEERVHLLIDWAEEDPRSVTYLLPGQNCIYEKEAGLVCDKQ